jgi:hypothetical protein
MRRTHVIEKKLTLVAHLGIKYLYENYKPYLFDHQGIKYLCDKNHKGRKNACKNQ